MIRIIVTLIEDQPKSREEWDRATRHREADDFNRNYVALRNEEYGHYLDRFQPWRWVAKSAGNHEPLAKSTESYFNEADCRHAIYLLFSAASAVALERHGNGVISSERLR